MQRRVRERLQRGGRLAGCLLLEGGCLLLENGQVGLVRSTRLCISLFLGAPGRGLPVGFLLGAPVGFLPGAPGRGFLLGEAPTLTVILQNLGEFFAGDLCHGATTRQAQAVCQG